MKNPSNIIGLTGKAGSGKTLVANLIQEYFKQKSGQLWQIKNYADALKQIASILTGLAPVYFEDRDLKENHIMSSRWTYYTIKGPEGEIKDQQSDQTMIVWDSKVANDILEVIRRYAEGTVNEGCFELISHSCTPRKFMQLFGTNIMRNEVYDNVWIDALWAHYKPFHAWVIGDVRFPNEAQTILDRGGVVIRVDRPGLETGNHVSETQMDHFTDCILLPNTGTVDELRQHLYDLLDSIYTHE